MTFRCPSCAFVSSPEAVLWRCPTCESPLELAGAQSFRRDQIAVSEASWWRYAAALPVPAGARVSLGEVMTPLLEGTLEGARVLYKLDYLFPTGSYKDRGAGLLVAWLRQRGITHVVEDSSGNAGAALAAYCARAGIRCTIYSPASTSPSKLVQARACGAEVVPVPGSRADTAAAVRKAAETAYYASHNWQPVFVQGVMTWALEAWEQLGFQVPDNLVMPVGNGSLLLGALRAFDLLKASGEITRLPRLFAVQSEAFAPLVRAFDQGLDDVPAVAGGETLAEGVAIAQPVRGPALLDALRRSNGRATAVGDQEIISAFAHLAREGIFVEPTSALAVAGLRRLLGAGTVGRQETTVVVLTGSGLKTTAQIQELIEC